MKTYRSAPLLLAAFLNVAPFVPRSIPVAALAAATPPVAFVLRWAAGALTLAGSFHAVSAASAVLVSATKIAGTVGTRLSYQIKISDGQGRTPESWLINGQSFGHSGSTKTSMPPGLSLNLSTGIISGIPTQAGIFEVPITAFEHSGLTGAELSFVLTFTLTGGSTPLAITVQPSGTSLHTGERLSLSVTATGTAPITYQWRRNGLDLPGQTSHTLDVSEVSADDAGDYLVVVKDANGSLSSSAVTVLVIPLSIHLAGRSAHSMSLALDSIPGRRYVIESTDSLDSPWATVTETNATSPTLTFVDNQMAGAQRFWRYHTAP